jgi:glycosyltransferase involved in cell wall biosynthesis
MHNTEKDSSISLSRPETNQRILKILFLEPQPCIRALKYAIGLRHVHENNVSLYFGHTGYSLSRLYGFGEEYFDEITQLDPEKIGDDVRRIINKYKPHVIHSHNAPNILTLTAIDIAKDIPVIHDVHEVLSIHNSGFFRDDDEQRLLKYREEERRACEESDGRIYATDGIRRYIQQQYNVDAQNDAVFYNYASASVMPQHFKHKISSKDKETHIVYIGCVTSVVKGSHYDLREIFRKIADHKIHIHIYPTSDHITKSNRTYRKLAKRNRFIHCHDTLDCKNLLYEITQYDLGWAGFNGVKNGNHLDLALPNKVFEYISSGLPVIAFPYKTIQHFIEKYDVGLIIKDVDELPEALENVNISELEGKAMRTRHKLTVESKIPKLVDFYNKMSIDG